MGVLWCLSNFRSIAEKKGVKCVRTYLQSAAQHCSSNNKSSPCLSLMKCLNGMYAKSFVLRGHMVLAELLIPSFHLLSL